MLNKFARKRTAELVSIEDINEELRFIEESDRDYITPSGKVYSKYEENKYFLRKTFINRHNGYVYVPIHTSEGEKQRRLHRILAKAYIPNPNNYDVVMHIDNNKSNYSLTNLKWGTSSENTQQAVNDGLLVNAKGFEDSQSMPIDVYSIYTGTIIKHCGSISEASRKTGCPKNTIINSANNQYTKIEKEFYFRWPNSTNIIHPRAVGMYDYDTDALIEVFINVSDCETKTGFSSKTISNQCFRGKPKFKTNKLQGRYFKFINYN